MEQKDSTLIQNRQIRVFISSTFQDMQGERDYLMRKVFPVLKERAAERDVTLIPLDLRWGITERESKTGKVVEICLKEIENTYPFFIGLVGDRYGWCPQKEEVSNLGEQYAWLQRDIESGLSVTEIEMQYGVLRNPHNLNAFFFLKNSENGVVENYDKLAKLKKSIRENGRYPVSSYCSVEDLGNQVEKAFSELIDRLFPTKLESEEDSDTVQHLSVFNKLTQYYQVDENGYSALTAFMKSEEKAFVVDGPIGSGKSALVANWLKTHTELFPHQYLYHSIGVGKTGKNEESIINRLSAYIEKERNAGNEKPVVVVDGNWEGLPITGGKLLSYIFRREQHARFIVCFPEGEDFSDDATVYHMPEHQGKEYWRNFIKSYLSVFCKKLTSEQIEHIVSNPLLRNYSFMKLFLDEVISFGSYEHLNEYIERLLKFSCTEEFYNNFIELLEEQFGKEKIQTVLSVITLSGDGIPEDTVCSIAGVTPLEWAQLYSNIKNLIVLPSGYLKLDNGYFTLAVAKRYHLNNPKQKEYDDEICDSYRNRIIQALSEERSTYAFCETGFQLYLSRRYDELLTHCLTKRELYNISDKKYIGFLGFLTDPGNNWDHEMFVTGLSLLKQYIPRYLDYLKEHPDDKRIFYKLTVLPLYYDGLKDDEPKESPLFKSLIELTEISKDGLFNLERRYPDSKEIKDSVPDTLEFLINGISALYSEEELLKYLAILEQYECNCSSIVKALVERCHGEGKYEQAISYCEKYGEHQLAAQSLHMLAKQAFQNEDFAKSEDCFRKAIEQYEIIAKDKPSERSCIAVEYKNLGLFYHKTGEEDKSTEAYSKAGEIFRELSNEQIKHLQEYVKVQYILAHGNRLNSASNSDIINWFVDIALNDDHEVQFLYGRMCEHGIMMEKNIEEAVNWYKLAAEAGHIGAQRRLGVIHYLGRGVEKNTKEAIKWFTMAADQGDAASLSNLASLYYNSEEPDYQKSFKYYKMLAERGDKDAQFLLATMFRDGEGTEQSYEKAFEWFSKAAQSGDAASQVELGKMYLRGMGVEANNEEAFGLFKKAAKDKNSEYYGDSARFLGILLSKGQGCERNLVDARYYFKIAAKKGDCISMYLLAEMYASGRGGAVDLNCAVKWFEKAAEDGIANAQFSLAKLYSEGSGVEQNLDKAVYWNGKALENIREQNGPHHPKTLRCVNCQAWYLYLQGKDYPLALQLAVEATSNVSSEMKAEERASYFDTLGAIYLALDNPSEAINSYEKCLRLTCEAYGEEDTRVKDLEYKIQKLKTCKNGE